MHIISSGYGMQYAPYIAVFMQSIYESINNSHISFYIQDIDVDCLDILCRTYPKTNFIKTNIKFPSRNIERIPLKMKIWTDALSQYEGKILFLDSDTIVSKSPECFFSDADIIFTTKNEQFQINTGVMLVKNSNAAQYFFQKWTNKIIDILNDEEKISIACSPQYHFGAVDQMAFYQMIDFSLEKKCYSFNTPYGDITLKSVPCNELNQTNSVPLNNDIYIYHYKGGWRSIIQHGEFSQYRGFFESYSMLKLFSETLNRAQKAMLTNGALPQTIEKFSIFPFNWFLLKIRFFVMSFLNGKNDFSHFVK